jgi:glycosyltransferase involved in cell wall biosynthesis
VKISFVSTFFPYRGGIAHFNALLHRELKKRGHEIQAINFKRQYPAVLFPGKTQEETNASTPDAYKIPSLRILDSINPWTWLKAGLLVRKSNPDIVLFRYWLGFFAPVYFVISLAVKLFSNTKVIYIVDNFYPHEKRPGDELLLWLATRLPDGYLTLSSIVQQDLKTDQPKAICTVAPHPVYDIFGHAQDKEAARRELGIGPAKKVVLFFGYIRAYKGLDLLLEAVPEILLSQPDTIFLIAGEFYSNEQEYQKLIDTLNIRSHLKLHTSYIPNNEVAKFFSAADCVVLPYKSATQSGIVQIAYHFNLPAIVTNVGGLGEIVVDKKTGLLIQDRSATAVSDAVISFFKDYKPEDFRSEIETVKKQYSWPYFASQLEELMRGLTQPDQ